jgi:L-lysine epsilon oxidase C-terminal domain
MELAPAPRLWRTRRSVTGVGEGLADFALPDFLLRYVLQWEAGDFIDDTGTPAPAETVPQQLDRVALQRCTGNNFFPGIEAGHNLKDRDIYARPFRLDRTNSGKVYPGCLSEIMAVPWQADFLACEGMWWPTQRPRTVMTRANSIPGSAANWRQPIPDFKGMVDNTMRLGFILPTQSGDQTVVVESERDPEFPRQAV